MSFDRLGLSAAVLRAVTDQNYTQTTPIQAQTIPLVLAGKDVLAGAQTGTGKTASFALPMLEILSKTRLTKGWRPLRALVLTPTRELAAQVGEHISMFSKYTPLRSSVIFGGVNINPQIKALKAGLDILVATPGRLLDHARQGTLRLSNVEILVLDEADRMLDMGFIHDIKKILALLPPKRQNLLFSATFSNAIQNLANRLLNNPVSVQVARRNTPAENVEQRMYPVDRARKRELLSHIITTGDWRQVLIFTRTKHGANRLSKQLELDGISSAAIHGNKSQGARTKALAAFKKGAIRALVATDLAARGLDIEKLPHVVNFELPNVPEDYVHRIGRTGRAGRDGGAISLVCVDERGLLRDIERVLKNTIRVEVVKGFEPNASIAPEPISNGRSGRQNGHRLGRAYDSGPERRTQPPKPKPKMGLRNSAGLGACGSEKRRAKPAF